MFGYRFLFTYLYGTENIYKIARLTAAPVLLSKPSGLKQDPQEARSVNWLIDVPARQLCPDPFFSAAPPERYPNIIKK